MNRIEEAGLDVRREGRAAVQVGIPEWEDALVQAAADKGVHGIEEGRQVAAAGREEDVL
jgi:hypothetical protein